MGYFISTDPRKRNISLNAIFKSYDSHVALGKDAYLVVTGKATAEQGAFTDCRYSYVIVGAGRLHTQTTFTGRCS
jgi:hypothetical protein